MRYALKFPAIRIERLFADAILEGRKVWEFRKQPLELGGTYYLLCLADADDRVVGAVDFSAVVGTYRCLLLSLVNAKPFDTWKKYTGLPKGWLEAYAKPWEIVYAHHIGGVSQFSLPAGGVFARSRLVFRSDNRALLESLQAEVRDKVLSLRVSRLDMLAARAVKAAAAKESRHA